MASGKASGRDANKPPRFSPPPTRVAVPDGDGGFEVVEVVESDFFSLTGRVSDLLKKELEAAQSPFPATALREVMENLVHAVPCTASVVLDPLYSSISICDTGPGMERTDIAFELGFTTADERLRQVIRGVGIGLNLALEELRSLGGDLLLDSLPGKGTFARLILSPTPTINPATREEVSLSQRQNNILFLLSEGDQLGPSLISSELNISLGTAHRDLVKLQEMGLVGVTKNGKRFLSNAGKSYLQRLLSL
ncbi:MAG: HTH domain-containing protein [Actinobacteria bacterium]|nr:HTH domain-containing protein [Actinomycetota bacterium]